MSIKFTKSNNLKKKVEKIIPLASQTFSKSYLQFIKGQVPLFVTHAKGSKIWDVDGNVYTDFINALCPVILGYKYKAIDDAIKEQLKKGINFSLPSTKEFELSKLLVEEIPCAEMVRFGKNGSDVTTGAIRLARAVTGREHIAICGYHGWHDWYIGSTARNLGVPKSTIKLTHKFNYNDIESLKRIFQKNKNKIAAVIMEPIHFSEPDKKFLKEVQRTAKVNGALLIFDEIVTGFRYNIGGAQKLLGITPDLASFGKSMANGMPISALVGKKKYMKQIGDIFYSFTNGGETLSIAAAIATIKEIKNKKALKKIWQTGEYLNKQTENVIKGHGLEEFISVQGMPCRSLIAIKDIKGNSELLIKSYLQQEIIQDGFLWFGQHIMSYSHTKKDVNDLLESYDKNFKKLKRLIFNNKLKSALKGKPITNIFKVR